MPRRVDHAQRKAEIADAVIRITIKGGLNAATFREVAAEAGVSVRLIQYYFGTKDQLLLETQRHVAVRAAQRLRARMASAGDAPRDQLRAVLTSFIPTDEESREAMLMFVALHTASLLDPTLARREAHDVPRALQAIIADLLRRAGVTKGADPDRDAVLLTVALPGLAQTVLDGMLTPDDAIAHLDYAVDRLVD